MEVPVYLFTGFLDAGKTKFIQETLEDPRFNTGDETMLILCEEGDEEYDPSRFCIDKVYQYVFENPEELTTEKLAELQEKTPCGRIIIEYNGMWLLDQLFTAMPEGWMVYQEFMFADASTFQVYNANMRNLVVDKLQSCDTIIFNRVAPDQSREELHKIVRAVNRRTEIIYEDVDGKIDYDNLPDPLPFDLNAPVVEIAPENYAVWYRDMSEELDKYDGKTVHVSGYAVRAKGLNRSTFIFGRPLMTCCVEDIQFAGTVCQWPEAGVLNNRDWVTITAKIAVEKHKAYDKPGPVLYVKSCSRGIPPQNDVATFY